MATFDTNKAKRAHQLGEQNKPLPDSLRDYSDNYLQGCLERQEDEGASPWAA